ncbi:MAG: Gfo/Idh/MocA family oxidoreductase [Armatimonadota bacterium]
MANALRFGIAGLGRGMVQARNVADAEGAELAAVCEIWEERAQTAVEELGCEWIRDFDEMLGRDDIDVIGVFTPSGMHGQMCEQALRAGKHAFCTKPMDIRVEACDRVIQAAEDEDLVFAVSFGSRYNPINHRIRNAVQSGALGKPVIGDLRMKWYRAQDYYDGGMPEGWRSRTETEGGSLANQAVHYLDLLQWWMGSVESVTGKKGTFAHNIQTEDTATAILNFESGAIGSVVTTTCSFPNLGTRIEITGAAGTLSWEDQQITRFTVAGASGDWDGDDPDYVFPEHAATPEEMERDISEFAAPDDLPANAVEDMVRAINEGTPVVCDGYEGRKTVRIIEAVYEASETGKTIKVN